MKRILLMLTLALVALAGCKKDPMPGQDATAFESPANCYIVSQAGAYSFKTVKGNSSESVGNVASAEVLWESFGTDVTPNVGDLVNNVTYRDGKITFTATDKKGNAVIAAKDASGEILWSWHIWLTDQPNGQIYYNNAGTMMDRNLGAISVTPSDVGALGLMYQWGRKDPFLGSSSFRDNVFAKSTITWPAGVSSNSTNGKIDYAIAHPTTFIARGHYNGDWLYTGTSSTDNTRWTNSKEEKSIYDPCPAGWRVPDGGPDGVWAKALGCSEKIDYESELIMPGTFCLNFAYKLGSQSSIIYPLAGCWSDEALTEVGANCFVWGAVPDYPDDVKAYMLVTLRRIVFPAETGDPASCYSVRCCRE